MTKHGTFVWYELMTTDPKAAVDFYTKLIGWGTQEMEGMEEPYTIWNSGDAGIGGLMQLPEQAKAAGAPPHWMAFIAVDDVDQTAEKAVALGATIFVPPQDIPKIGRFCVFADPQGAAIALYKSLEDYQWQYEPEAMQRFSWHELATSDYEKAFSFYSELFGWTIEQDMDMGEGMIYRIYAHEAAPHLGGMYTKPAEMPGPPAWLYYINVEDVAASIEIVKELGGQVLNGPMEVPGGSFIAQCMDPQGAVFAMHSRSAAEE